MKDVRIEINYDDSKVYVYYHDEVIDFVDIDNFTDQEVKDVVSDIIDNSH